MAEYPNSALAATVTADRDRLAASISGLHALASIDFISEELRVAMLDEATNRERRRDLLQAVLDRLEAVFQALLALEADGYPAMPNAEILAELVTELRRQIAELVAAANVFDPIQEAVSLSLTFSEPEPLSP